MGMMPKSRRDEEELALPATSRRKDGGLWLLKVLTLALVFAAGTVAGLSFGVHFTQRTSPNELFFQRKSDADIWGKGSLSFENLIRPSSLIHTMTDEELFWRASMVAKREEGYPFKRVPKVAFLFLVKGPLPLSPLWDRFFKGGEGLYTIYVHPIPGYKLNVPKASAFYGRQIPSKETKWGTISIVDAERRLLANALLDYSNERFVLLSESCIPLYDFSTIYGYLMNSDHSFVHSYDEDTLHGRGRYPPRMAPAIKLSQWRKGSQWFELHRSLAVSVVADVKYRDLFGKYHIIPGGLDYSDEHYLPTFLTMFHGASIANRTTTWTYWPRLNSHPATFGSKNITAGLLKSIRTKAVCMYNSKPTEVCYLFARKFSPDALQPLLDIMKF